MKSTLNGAIPVVAFDTNAATVDVADTGRINTSVARRRLNPTKREIFFMIYLHNGADGDMQHKAGIS